jgi:hypothetical protein
MNNQTDVHTVVPLYPRVIGRTADFKRGRSTGAAGLGSLVFECPTARIEIATGIDLDLQTFRMISGLTLRIRCPTCTNMHEFRIGSGLVAPYKLLETARDSESNDVSRDVQSSNITNLRITGKTQSVPKAEYAGSVEDRLVRELTRRIRKLRWMRMDEEAQELQHALRPFRSRYALLTDPRDTD